MVDRRWLEGSWVRRTPYSWRGNQGLNKQVRPYYCSNRYVLTITYRLRKILEEGGHGKMKLFLLIAIIRRFVYLRLFASDAEKL